MLCDLDCSVWASYWFHKSFGGQCGCFSPHLLLHLTLLLVCCWGLSSPLLCTCFCSISSMVSWDSRLLWILRSSAFLYYPGGVKWPFVLFADNVDYGIFAKAGWRNQRSQFMVGLSCALWISRLFLHWARRTILSKRSWSDPELWNMRKLYCRSGKTFKWWWCGQFYEICVGRLTSEILM